jgi:hypothetical protein
MRYPLPLILGLVLTVGACAQISGSRLNPLNWFGGSTSVAAPTSGGVLRPLIPEGARAVVADTRVLVGEVTGLVIEPTATGAIIRATGNVPGPGYFNAQLVLVGVAEGVLTYEFRVAQPAGGASATATRSLTVATTLTRAQLASLRRIEVVGRTNARVVNR